MHIHKFVPVFLVATFSSLANSQIRHPSLQHNVLRGIQAARRIEDVTEPLRLARVWNYVNDEYELSSNTWDFKAIALGFTFINNQGEFTLGVLKGGQGPEWGTWPNRWKAVSTSFEPRYYMPIDFEEVTVLQTRAAQLANRVGDRGPWRAIQLVIQVSLGPVEPLWFFIDRNLLWATVIGGRTGMVTTHVRVHLHLDGMWSLPPYIEALANASVSADEALQRNGTQSFTAATS